MASTAAEARALESLVGSIRGEVLTKTDAAYDAARLCLERDDRPTAGDDHPLQRDGGRDRRDRLRTRERAANLGAQRRAQRSPGRRSPTAAS
jgi:hypothetical protein